MTLKNQRKTQLQQAFQRIIVSNFRMLVRGSEAALFEFLCDRSLRFGDYSVWVSARQFLTGDLEHGICGLVGWTGKNVSRVRGELKKKGLIFYSIDYSEPQRPIQYTINVPGIWLTLRRVYAHVQNSDTQNCLRILHRSVHHFTELGYREVVNIKLDPKLEKGIMRIEDAIKEGVDLSKSGLSRRKEKRDKKEVTAPMVPMLLREYCAELGVPYHELGWTNKEWRSAKNWLKYCKNGGYDPRKVLYDVCSFWKSFRTGIMVNDEGRQIVLPETVSFWKYYQYRREIGAWIEANRDRSIERKTKWQKVGEQFRKEKEMQKKAKERAE
jgi:hypothetical protein